MKTTITTSKDKNGNESLLLSGTLDGHSARKVKDAILRFKAPAVTIHLKAPVSIDITVLQLLAVYKRIAKQEARTVSVKGELNEAEWKLLKNCGFASLFDNNETPVS